MSTNALLKLPAAAARVTLGKSKFLELVAAGVMPQPVRFGPKAVRWVESELNDALEKLMAEREKAA